MKKGLQNYQKRVKGALVWYGVLALGVVPIFTLLMGTKDNILTTSMSAMGNADGGIHLMFIIWTILFCAVFTSFVGYILILTKNTHSKIRILIYIAVAVLIFGNILPFLPETFPGFAELHNFCAQISSISLAVVLMLLALTLHKWYPEVFKKAVTFVLVIWAVLVTLMALFGTKSITEMAGILLACVYLFAVAVWLMRTKDFDAVESLKQYDATQAEEEADKLEKRAAEAKDEYLKLEAKARRARIEAMEMVRQAKRDERAKS